MTYEKKQGTPRYPSRNALNGRMSKANITRMPKSRSEVERKRQMDCFKLGLLIGFLVAGTIMCLVLWLWVIPTMDAAVQTAQGMVA